MPADTLLTILACISIASLGGVAVVVLPWRAEELTDSWLAWRVLAALVRGAAMRLREFSIAQAPRPVRSIG